MIFSSVVKSLLAFNLIRLSKICLFCFNGSISSIFLIFSSIDWCVCILVAAFLSKEDFPDVPNCNSLSSSAIFISPDNPLSLNISSPFNNENIFVSTGSILCNIAFKSLSVVDSSIFFKIVFNILKAFTFSKKLIFSSFVKPSLKSGIAPPPWLVWCVCCATCACCCAGAVGAVGACAAAGACGAAAGIAAGACLFNSSILVLISSLLILFKLFSLKFLNKLLPSLINWFLFFSTSCSYSAFAFFCFVVKFCSTSGADGCACAGTGACAGAGCACADAGACAGAGAGASAGSNTASSPGASSPGAPGAPGTSPSVSPSGSTTVAGAGGVGGALTTSPSGALTTSPSFPPSSPVAGAPSVAASSSPPVPVTPPSSPPSSPPVPAFPSSTVPSLAPASPSSPAAATAAATLAPPANLYSPPTITSCWGLKIFSPNFVNKLVILTLLDSEILVLYLLYKDKINNNTATCFANISI